MRDKCSAAQSLRGAMTNVATTAALLSSCEMRLATLIFDLDGTLSDPSVGIGRSLNYALEAFGYRRVSERELSRYIGPPLDWAFRDIVPDASPDRVLALVAKYRERYRDVGYAENTVYPGIADALAGISSEGVRM